METFSIGNASIHRVEELIIQSAMELLTDDPALIEVNRHWLSPHFLNADGTRDFVFQSWIVEVDGRIIVIDPCNGNDRSHVVPIFDHLKTPYIERFETTGIRPQDVDYVFCTHLHHDHCGWCTQLVDGRFVPTFPNASYLFVDREYRRWDPRLAGHQPVSYNTGVFEQSVLPIMEAGLGTLVSDSHDFLPGCTILPAYGHTQGHSMLHLRCGDEEAYFTGDVFHHPLQVMYPELHLPGCDDLAMAIRTRIDVANVCAASNALVIPAHFAYPHIGFIDERAELDQQPDVSGAVPSPSPGLHAFSACHLPK